MATSQTTLVIALLAGDSITAGLMDNLLYEIHTGLNIPGIVAPKVFCFYYRWLESERAPKAHHFPMDRSTLTFAGRQLAPGTYPLPHLSAMPGTVPEQVHAFLSHVRSNLPEMGPIRFIFGAHGFAGVGINPIQLITLLFLLIQLASDLENKELRLEIQRTLIEILGSGALPDGLRAKLFSSAPDITLNDMGDELNRFPHHRLQSLILNTCSLSSVETISALVAVPHHIACETVQLQVLRFSDWFNELANPQATETEMTQHCFQSLTSGAQPNAWGAFSSHRTTEIESLLSYLNALGRWLKDFYLVGPIQEKRRAIRQARDSSSVSPVVVDVVKLCLSLNEFCHTPSDLTAPIIESILVPTGIQVADPVKPREWVGSAFTPYRAISVYFPRREIGAHLSGELPLTFRLATPQWCEFIDTWLS